MRYFIYLLLLVSAFTLFTGCEDDDNAVIPPTSIDGKSLLGLVDGRSMFYLQTDTYITLDPFTITVTDTTLTVLITGSGDDWIIHNNSNRLINLKVGSNSIIQNGYWRKINEHDSLIYIAVPPLLMERSLSSNLIWDYYTPFYTTDEGPILLPFYIANFGFRVTKEYEGTEDIITPAGEFKAHRFSLTLYTSAFGNDPVAEIIEYYAVDVGLIKQELFNGALNRTIILATYAD